LANAQSTRIDVLEQEQRQALLVRVRFLEQLGTWVAWITGYAATAALGLTVVSRLGRHFTTVSTSAPAPLTIFNRARFTLTQHKDVILSSLLVWTGWFLLKKTKPIPTPPTTAATTATTDTTDTTTAPSGVQRKLSILYSTAIVLFHYKYYRWYSTTFHLSDDERELYLKDTHNVMALFVYRCMRRWGGFWIKAGQYMSARADITPAQYVKELTALQDNTASQPFSDIRITVEKSLQQSVGPGTTLDDVFTSFDETPLASASIAQCHRAVLKNTSQEVVVKVQHKGIAHIMLLDMAALLQICRLIAWSEPEFDFGPIMKEWTDAAVHELDFVHESTSLMEVADGLSGQGEGTNVPVHLSKHVVVPRAISGFTTRCLMVLAFSPGVSIGSKAVNDALSMAQKTSLLQLITEATAHTIFHLGIFNGDPHPGNILVELDHPIARPVLLDFGLSKRLDDNLRLAFCRMILSAASYDMTSLVESFEQMGWIFEADNDSSETLDFMRFFFRDTAPIDEAKKEHRQFNQAMRKKRIARQTVQTKKPVKAFPGNILFFIRALELLRGLCSKLEVRQSPMKIFEQSARSAMCAALLKHDHRTQHPLAHSSLWPPLNTTILQQEMEELVVQMEKEGLLLACQVCVVHNGTVVCDIARGPVAPDTTIRSVRSDSIFNSFSCTKALVATSMHLLIAKGKAKYEDYVCKYWPAFGQNGKDKITIEELLSHRAGLHSALPEEMNLQKFCNFENMCAWYEQATPSKGYDDGYARYHALSYGWLCGKLIEILSGLSFSDFVRQNIAVPLGLEDELMVGVPKKWTLPSYSALHTDHTRFHANRLVTLDAHGSNEGGTSDISKNEIQAMLERVQDRIKKMQAKKNQAKVQEEKKKAGEGKGSDASFPLSKEEKLQDMLESFKGKEWMMDNRIWNSSRVRSAVIPAANGHFSARALSIFYHALSIGKILPPKTLERATSFSAKDVVFGGEFGLGYKRYAFRLPNGDVKMGFGHAGAGGSIGLALPFANISFGLTVSRPVHDAEPRQRLLSLLCRRLGVGEAMEENDGIH